MILPAPNLRVQVRQADTGLLIADNILYYTLQDWRDPIIETLQRMKTPCYHLRIDLMLPDGSPGFCEQNATPYTERVTPLPELATK